MVNTAVLSANISGLFSPAGPVRSADQIPNGDARDRFARHHGRQNASPPFEKARKFGA